MICHVGSFFCAERGFRLKLLRKMVAPGIYYISSPLLAMIGVLLVCSVMVYVVVPVFAMAGIYFNNAAKAKQKKKKIIKALKKALEPLLPDAGLSWTDVQDMKLWPYCTVPLRTLCSIIYIYIHSCSVICSPEKHIVVVAMASYGQLWPAIASYGQLWSTGNCRSRRSWSCTMMQPWRVQLLSPKSSLKAARYRS